MRKKRLLLLTVTTLMLASCGGPITSSPGNSSSDISSPPSSSSSNDSSNSSSSEIDVEEEKQKIMAMIEEAKNLTNYTYGYLDEGAIVNPIIINPQYIYDAASKTATAALESFENKDETLLYSLNHNGETFQVLNALNYTDANSEVKPYKSVSELDYLALLFRDDVNWSEDSLIHQSGYYYIEDRDIIAIFSNMFGLASQTNGIMRVVLSLENEETIRISFAPNFLEGSNVDLIDSTIGVIADIGISSDEELEKFIADFTLNEERLTTENLTYLNGDLITYDSELNIFIDDALYQKATAATYSYDLESQEYAVIDKRDVVEQETRYAANEEGALVRRYLGPDNVVHDQLLGGGFQESIPNFVEALDINAFVKVDQNTYRYYGYKYDSLVKTLSGNQDGMGVVIDLTAHLDDAGNLIKITALSRDVELIDYGVFHYEMTLTFKEGEALSPLAPYGDEFDDYSIALALDKFDSSHGYQLVATRVGTPDLTSALIAKDNILLFDDVSYNTAPGSENELIHTYHGFIYQEEHGLTPFAVDENMRAYTTDEGMDGYLSIDDYIGINQISEKVLTFNEDDTAIVPKKNVSDFNKNLFLGPNGSYLIDETLSFSYDQETDSITSYSYKTSGFDDEEVAVTYGAELPSNIDFSGIQDSFVPPTSWQEGAPEIYETLINKSYVGEEYVAEVPYLYDVTINDSWMIGNDGITEVSIINNYYLIGSDEAKAYMDKYVELLLASGYTLGQGNRYGKEGLPFVIRVVGNGENSMPDIRISNAEYYPFVPFE